MKFVPLKLQSLYRRFTKATQNLYPWNKEKKALKSQMFIQTYQIMKREIIVSARHCSSPLGGNDTVRFLVKNSRFAHVKRTHLLVRLRDSMLDH